MTLPWCECGHPPSLHGDRAVTACLGMCPEWKGVGYTTTCNCTGYTPKNDS